MNIVKKIAYASVAIASSIPMIVSAADSEPAFTGFETPTVAGMPEGSIISILTTGMNWLLIIVGILGVIGFVIAGIIYLTAAGDETQIEKGKSAMIYSIVGVIVALIGVIIIGTVKGLLGGGSTSSF